MHSGSQSNPALGSMRASNVKRCTLRYRQGKAKLRILKLILVFHHLSSCVWMYLRSGYFLVDIQYLKKDAVKLTQKLLFIAENWRIMSLTIM